MNFNQSLYILIIFLKTNWFNVASTIGIVVSIFIGLVNYYSSKPKLSIITPASELQKCIFEPDRNSANDPDKFFNYKYRIFIDLIINNQSRMPISIYEIRLNDDLKITPYNDMGDSYELTIDNGQRDLGNGIKGYGPNRKMGITINGNQLQPIINLNPYSSIRGMLVFKYNHEISKFLKNKQQLKVLTPIKTFSFSIDAFQYFDNHRLPQDQWHSENV